MRIIVIAVGRLRPPFSDDVQHYQKLLAGHCRLDLIELREDQEIDRRIPERAFLSVLDRGGETYDSIAFSRWLEDRRQGGRDVCFLVGGPHGFPPGFDVGRCEHRLSFGPLTLPHQLARVVLLEQLYRGHKILAREPYHY